MGESWTIQPIIYGWKNETMHNIARRNILFYQYL